VLTLTEPVTLVTDYLLGGLAATLAWRLRRRPGRPLAVSYWAAALAAIAVASVIGGTYHGIRLMIGETAAHILWTLTTVAMGAASFLLLAAALSASFSNPIRYRLITAAAVKLALYVVWMLQHDDFAFVIYEYGSTLLLVLVLVAAGRTQGARGHRAYIVAGILVSGAAALLQQSGIRLHRHFNHNDLMHVVQMGGVWLLYQGGARLEDEGAPNGRHA